MNKIILFIFCLVLAVNLQANNLEKNDPISKKKRVLIFTKNGLTLNGEKGYVHENITNSIKALKEICEAENIDFDNSEDALLFNKATLSKYDAIIFSNSNNEVFDNENQKVAFQNYIKGGGGFIGIHSANAVERDWPWYWALVGGKFVRHAPHQEFDVVVVDKNHPSTNFLDRVWKVKDECYYSNNLNPDINVLLASDLRTVEDKKKVEYPNDIFGNYFPLCWSNEFEGARQWYTALGHDAETYDDPIFRKHLRGGILWVLNVEK